MSINGCNRSGNCANIRGLNYEMGTPGKFESQKSDTDVVQETELNEIKIMAPANSPNLSLNNQESGVACYNGGCSHGKTSQKRQLTESPWHRQKTYSLVFIIVAFVVWLIIYCLLSAFDML